MSEQRNPYGLKYFDRPGSYKEDEEETGHEDFVDKSCPGNCCDSDCECDDCARCSQNSLDKEESYLDAAAA
jgi:hypothetical protein